MLSLTPSPTEGGVWKICLCEGTHFLNLFDIRPAIYIEIFLRVTISDFRVLPGKRIRQKIDQYSKMARTLHTKAEHVGSFLRPVEIREARAKGVKGSALRAIEDKAIAQVVKEQLAVGKDATSVYRVSPEWDLCFMRRTRNHLGWRIP